MSSHVDIFVFLSPGDEMQHLSLGCLPLKANENMFVMLSTEIYFNKTKSHASSSVKLYFGTAVL